MVNIPQQITDGAVQTGVDSINRILAARGVSTQGSTPAQTIEEVKEDCRVGLNDDEVVDVVDDEQDFNNALDTGTEEEVTTALQKKGSETLKEEVKGYPISQPITPSSLARVVQETEQNRGVGGKVVNQRGFQTGFINENLCREVAQKPSKRDEFIYGENTFEICGKSKKCTEVAFNLDLQKYTSRYSETDIEGNLELLTDIITFEVVKNFPKVYSIAVCDNHLIINNTSFIPNVVNLEARFPLDCMTYVKNGCIAPFINWRKLFKHAKNTCGMLSIDSCEFYLTYVGDSLGLGRKIGVSTAFKVLHYLTAFYLEGEDVTKGDLLSPKSAKIKKKLATKKRSFNLLSGYRLSVCAGTQAFQDFGFNSLKNYATNRGDKGWVRYTIGTVARLGLAGFSGVLNLGTHLARGIFQCGKEFYKGAVTPVTDEDIYNQ